jgi:hypothetical protein
MKSINFLFSERIQNLEKNYKFMYFSIFLSSPLIVIIDPLFLEKETIDYILRIDVQGKKPWSLASEINKELFPDGGSIVGFYEVQNFNQGEWEINVSEIFRIFKKDFEEYDLSEECLFGVDTGEILVIEFDYLKIFLENFVKKAIDYSSVRDELINNKDFQRRFHLIEAFDIENDFTDFIGDGRYVASVDLIKVK